MNLDMEFRIISTIGNTEKRFVSFFFLLFDAIPAQPPIFPITNAVRMWWGYPPPLLPAGKDATKGAKCVANMAPYAISSSLILVIHDNMINETNHIV
jgi:hypothetical protein